MRFSDIPRNPDANTLRQFAGLWIAFFGGIGCYRWFQEDTWQWFFLSSAIIVGLPGLIYPKGLRPLFVAWMILAFPIGWLVSRLVLSLIYYVVFTPLGIVLRLFGHDPLRLKRPTADSYWIGKQQQQDPRRYLKQF